jgi:hypothetical protein
MMNSALRIDMALTSDISNLKKPSKARKRSRNCRATTPSPGLFVLITAAMSLLLSQPVNGFLTLSDCVERSILLRAVRSSIVGNAAQLVQPKIPISEERRLEALKAMKRRQVETALDGVDAQMLELLSDRYLYPPRSRPSNPTTRPKGRPAYVPGAMNYETLTKFRERQEVIERIIGDREISAISAYISPDLSKDKADGTDSSARTQTFEPEQTTEDVALKTTRGGAVKGSKVDNGDVQELPEATNGSTEIKKRKIVVKNLPTPRDRSNEKRRGRPPASSGRPKGINLELQKYFQTELLTADEEYSLGMKVKLMMRCDRVHEGLSLHLMRIPTMEEWAAACG